MPRVLDETYCINGMPQVRVQNWQRIEGCCCRYTCTRRRRDDISRRSSRWKDGMAENGSNLGLADKGLENHVQRGVIGGDDAGTLLSPTTTTSIRLPRFVSRSLARDSLLFFSKLQLPVWSTIHPKISPRYSKCLLH